MQESDPATRVRLLRRPATRRALLAGAATAAAGGTAAAVLAFAGNNEPGGSSQQAAAPNKTATPDASATAAALLAQPIEDPKHRAAHLLRRAGWGGTQAEIDEFALLSREAAVSRLLDVEGIDNAPLNARVESMAFNLTTPGPGLDGRRPSIFRDMQR